MIYTEDALIVNSHVFDETGHLYAISRIYEMFISKRVKSIDKVLSYDDGYIPSDLVNVQHAHMLRPIIIRTKSGRKIYGTSGQNILTENGFVKVSNLAIGMNLKTLDFYMQSEHHYGYSKYSQPAWRIRAFLRGHSIPFDIEGDATITDDMYIHCVDYDTEHPVLFNDSVTLGLNNYREFLMDHYNVEEWSYDPIVSMNTLKYAKHCMIVKVNGVGNYVVHTGAIFKSSPLDD